MDDYSFVADRVPELGRRIQAAAARAGRDPSRVELMAVSKFHPLAAVEAAYAAGLRLFGENRVQEAEGKFPAFLAAHPEARLELIGHLQSNKAKKAATLFSRIQSLDSLELLAELGKRSRARMEAEGGPPLEILLELHTGEESKSGFPSLEALYAACELLGEGAPGSLGGALSLRGLMTMAPYTKDEGPIRASFRALRSAFEALSLRFAPPRFDVLSMGMTNDYEIAVEEGSTLLRIGTALFGDRAPL